MVRKGLGEEWADGDSPLRLPLGEGRPRGGRGRREEKRTGTRRFGLVYGDGGDLAQHMVFAFHGATRVFFYHSLFHPLLSLPPCHGLFAERCTLFQYHQPPSHLSIRPPISIPVRVLPSPCASHTDTTPRTPTLAEPSESRPFPRPFPGHLPPRPGPAHPASDLLGCVPRHRPNHPLLSRAPPSHPAPPLPVRTAPCAS